MNRATWPLALALALLAPATARPELEPPPEAAAGADYEVETADSLAGDQLEVSFGAAGSTGAGPRRTRRLRFSGDSLGGTLREGAGDALAGGTIEGRGKGRSFEIGRLAPRWGRGLVLGSAAEPWSLTAADRGARATYRGRSGQGAWLRGEGRVPYQALYGRFGKRSLAGVAIERRGLRAGALADRGGETQASLSGERGGAEAEWAVDRTGRWRAEAAFGRPLAIGRLSGRVRGGHADFVSLAEPKRSGPAQALAVGLDRRAGSIHYATTGALWRFRPGLTGARAAAEAALRSRRHGRIAVGLEEQHGVRRATAGLADPGSLRQGWWWEWRGGSPDLGLALRHEGWGARRLAREPVRSVTSARAAVRGPAGVRLRLTHTVFRVRRGESLYLAEAESDRLVLRALSGQGDRTRLEVTLPAGGGSLRAGLTLARSEGKASRAQWRLEWTRLGRWRGGR